MSDVIRRAIIEIETRQKRTRLEAPGTDAASQGFKSQAEFAGKAETATDRASESTKRHAEVVRNSATTMGKDFRDIGQGVFRLTRGLTLLANSGSDDLKRLVQQVALAQAAFDVFVGTSKALPILAAAVGGPVTAAIAAATVAIGAGVIAWTKWKAAAREALEEAAERARSVEDQMIAFNKRIERDNERRRELSGGLIDSSLTDRSRLARLIEAVDQEAAAGAKARRAAATSTETGGRERLEFVASNSREAVASAERQRDLLKQIYDIQKGEHDNVKRATTQLTSLGIQGAQFGSGGIPGLSAIGVFGAQAVGSTVTTRLQGQLEEHTQSLERLLANLARIITFYTRKTDEISDRITGANPS